GAPFTLAPGAGQTVVLRFSPTSKQEKTAAIEFTSNAAANPTLPLQGVGSAAGFSVTPSTLSFDIVHVGDTKVLPLIYCNTGGSPLTVNELSLSSAGFTVLSPPTLPQTLGPGECDTVEVQFAPTAEGAAS